MLKSKAYPVYIRDVFMCNSKCPLQTEFTEVSIRSQTTRSKDPCPNIYLPLPKNIPKSPVLFKEKENDFESMITFMCLQECEFFEVFCHLKRK